MHLIKTPKYVVFVEDLMVHRFRNMETWYMQTIENELYTEQ